MFSRNVKAELNQELPMVEVETYQDSLASYKERRDDDGIYFGINYESLPLTKYISTIDNNTYKKVFDNEGIPLILLNVDYKYNFLLGSLAAGVELGQGTLSGSGTMSDRSISVLQYGIGLKYTLDTILEEPWVAPYVGMTLWKMQLSEKSSTDSFSATTQIGYKYTVGVLLQLNGIDKETAQETNFTWGLENTYLDLFATKYDRTTASKDPNTETDLIYGGGLRLEF